MCVMCVHVCMFTCVGASMHMFAFVWSAHAHVCCEGPWLVLGIFLDALHLFIEVRSLSQAQISLESACSGDPISIL